MGVSDLVHVPLLQQVVVAGGAGADRARRVLGPGARRPGVLLAEDGEVRLLALDTNGHTSTRRHDTTRK